LIGAPTISPPPGSLADASPKGLSWLACVGWVGVFAALFAYLLLIIDPRILYHAYIVSLPGREVRIVFPEFFLGREFATSVLCAPGGAAEYLGALGSQLFYYDAVGAIILTAMAAALFVLSAGVMRKIGLRQGRLIGMAAVLVWTAAWGRYTFHLADQLALLGALVFVRLYVGLRRPPVRLIGFVALSPVFYVAVGGPYLLAAALCGLFELVSDGRKVLAAICFAVGVAVPVVVGVLLLGVSVADAAGRLTGLLALEPLETSPGLWEKLLVVAMVGVLVGPAVAVWAIRRLVGQAPQGAAGRARPVWTYVAVAVVVAVGAYAATAAHDCQTSRVLRMNRHSKLSQWDELLDVAATCRPRDLSSYSCRQINRALFETGQLGDRMFAFPQFADGLLPRAIMGDITFGLEDDLLAVGAVNQAEHLAAEALTVRGPTPHLLRVLARAFLVKGELQAAKVFLTRLQGDLIYGQWARECMVRLEEDPELSLDEDIQRLRSVIPRRDFVGGGELEPTLIRLLEANPGNRMAFEYLMAHYMLNWQLDDLAEAVTSGAAATHYSTLPEHVAEALIIHSTQEGEDIDLGELDIPEAVLSRAEQFRAAESASGGSPQALREALAKDLPNSYFRYHRTRQSGGSGR